jgi:portal protein
MGRITDGLKHAWNAFKNAGADRPFQDYGSATYSANPDRVRFTPGKERSIIASILTRLSIDVSAIPLQHVRLDDEGRYLEPINSGLNYCLTQAANIDQPAQAFRQDIVGSLFDDGYIAVVPVDTTINPAVSGSYDIQTMRVGQIINWYPEHVKVSLFNQDKGIREHVVVQKSTTAIVQNPLYSVMNEQNSTLKRLTRKLALLDVVDEQSSSGKLDLIIQLPYVVKSEARRQQADQRRKDIEFQLSGSKYGIAYTDGTEKVTQLNRPAENNLLAQVQYLEQLLYEQLGLTKSVMDGTADAKTMINYYNRTIMPIVIAIVEAMRVAFLTKTARTQNQSILYFRDIFSLVPPEEIADIADKFSRNEILTPNEIRQVIGIRPSKDPKADKLQNSNMPAPSESANPTQEGVGPNDEAEA